MIVVPLTHRILVIAAAGLSLSTIGTAHASTHDSIERLRADGGDVDLRLDAASGSVRLARLGSGMTMVSASPEAAARDFIARYGEAFGVGDSDTTLHRPQVWSDRLGHTHVDLQQHYRGLPVFGSSVRVHIDASNRVIAAQSFVVPRGPLDVTATVGPAEASAAAADALSVAATADSLTLGIFDLGLVNKQARDPRLAYAVRIRSAGTDATVYVDANNGDVVLVSDHVHTVLDRTVYQFDYGPGSEVWTEADGPYMGGNAEVQDLIDFTEDAYDLFFNVSGGSYASYDGESAVMEGIVDAPLQCPNAQWNGVSTNYCSGLVTDDVVAHEWAHGYTQLTQDLIYAYQPGALNESYSDIFGESVDLLNGAGLDEPGDLRTDGSCSGAGDSVRWLIGEDTVGLGGAIRDMWTPSCMAHPDRVEGLEYFCNFGGGFFDNGGVHINSGVPNHAFSLLVDGGEFNGTTVPAIGSNKALAIYWRTMTVYQSEVSGFVEHADALQMACNDLMVAGEDLPDALTGDASGEVIDTDDCAAVDAAIAATELQAANPCGDGPLFDLDDAPDPCADGEGSTVFADDFEDDFAWTVTNAGVAADYTPRDWESVDTLPDAKPGSAAYAIGDQTLGNCFDDDQSGVMHLDSPSIELPDDNGRRVLSFSHWLAAEPLLDGGNLKLSVNGGPFALVPASAFSFNGYNEQLDFSNNPLAGEAAFSGNDVAIPTGSWAESVADLSDLTDPGDTVTLRFDFGVNQCNGLFGWYVDDVRVVQCAADGGTDTGDATGDTSGGTTVGVDDTAGSDDTTGANDSGVDDTTSSTGAVTTSPSTTLPAEDDTGDSGAGGTADDTGDDGSAAGVDDGCSCRSSTAPTGTALWIMMFGLGAIRRRSRH